jgi:hypothetical protein
MRLPWNPGHQAIPGPQQESVLLGDLTDGRHGDIERVGDEADGLIEEQGKVRTGQCPLAEDGDNGMTAGSVVRPAIEPDRGGRPTGDFDGGSRGWQSLSLPFGYRLMSWLTTGV